MEINRRAVIERHNPRYKEIKKHAPLSVGNGRFCFTADFTGLQTFFDEYGEAQDAFPLCTMAEWGWHSYPSPPEDEAKLRMTPYNTYGRNVYYASDDTGQEELFKRIRVNAHKFNLGKIGFEYKDKPLQIEQCKPVDQLLSMYEGILFSEFQIEGKTVKTETFVHPQDDAVFVRITSPLLNEGLRVTINFPYGSHKKSASDFESHNLHFTSLIKQKEEAADLHGFNGLTRIINLERKLDGAIYNVLVSGKGFNINLNKKEHLVNLTPESETVELSIKFQPRNIPCLSQIGITYNDSSKCSDSFDEAKEKCKTYWVHYWSSGGFIDFSPSSDSRAFELERRMILSQYLIAIQSRGKIPPAETGLTCNSWYGKFHLEMHFWHHAHFALWGRSEEVIKALEYYKKILPAAKEIASSQGYQGARWPKMCDPSGRNTPSSVAVFLIWQQPHPIMFAELIWRAEKRTEVLNEYREIVIETAEFMKSFIHWDGSRYVIGPPYIPAQERHDPEIVLNAPYELEYFRLGFEIADNWLKRLGEKQSYKEITEKLSLPSLKDGVYLAHENCPDTFSRLPFYTDHPSMLQMYGVLESEKVEINIMSATLDKVQEVWDKKTFYGWDFPVMAMTACRLGRYADAVNLLLMDSPKNTYLENGHNKMTGDDALPLYLPGNGGLLLAIAMMAAGFDEKKGPLFPEGFKVNAEGITPYI